MVDLLLLFTNLILSTVTVMRETFRKTKNYFTVFTVTKYKSNIRLRVFTRFDTSYDCPVVKPFFPVVSL